LLVSHPIKPVDGWDVTLLCAVASMISPPQNTIAGSNEMNSFFTITFLSLKPLLRAESRTLVNQMSLRIEVHCVGLQGDLRKPVLRIES
jgi:hypothetical protein